MNTKKLLRSSLAILGCVYCSFTYAQHLVATGLSQENSGMTQQINAPLSGDQVVHELMARNAERAAALENYTSTRVYHLEYKGFSGDHEAEITVHVEFTAPYAKKITVVSESGSKFLVAHVLKRLLETEENTSNSEDQKTIALNTTNYAMTLTGYEPSPEGGIYTLKLDPKTENRLLYRGEIRVDARDFAVTHIAGEPAKSPSFWIENAQIEHRYQNVSGFWLPLENRTVSKVRGGQVVLTIEYRDYKITRSKPLQSVARLDLQR